jgi:hypothetical protein
MGQLVGDKLRAILAVSTYEQRTPGQGTDPEAEAQIRESIGGQLTPLPYNRPRWYLADIESAMAAADVGDLQLIGELCRALRRDGMVGGLLSTRTDGLVQLPVRWSGNEEQIAALRARNGTRSLFSEMFPPSELALLAGDGILAGVGVGELLPVRGRDFPVLCRLDPAYLRYRWNEGRWYYNSTAGLLPITPGDGRWILHTPCGRVAPWQNSSWRALSRAFITKEHSWLMRQNYAAKLANPARLATAPQAASQDQKVSWFEQVLNWGINTVFSVTPGYKVELLELRGQGYKVFAEDMGAADHEIMISLAGQEVTTTGGAGFSNMDLFRSIKADLIKSTGDGLGYTLNTQGLPPWVVRRWGIDALDDRAIAEWDTSQPKDLNAEASSLTSVAGAIEALRRVAAKYGREIDVTELFNRFSVPVLASNDNAAKGARAMIDADPDALIKFIEMAKSAGMRPTAESILVFCEAVGIGLEKVPGNAVTTRIELAPTDIAKVVRVDEARASQGLPAFGDDRGKLTLLEMETAPAAAPVPAEGAAPVDGASPTPEQLDPDGDGEPGEPAEPDAVQALANKMTEAGVQRCEHGAVNRCRLCGIERVRDFEQGENGEPVWKVAWRPIPKQQEAA